MYQGGIAKFDRKTENFQVYPVPKEWQGDHTQQSMVSPSNSHVDGKVWTNNQDTHAIYRFDLATGQYENLGEFQIPGAGRSINAYGIPSDSENNLYLLEFGSNNIGRIDAKTKEFKVFSTITPIPDRAAADSTRKIGSGSRNMAPMASVCWTRKRETSRNGGCRPPGARPTMSCRIKTAKSGPAPCGPTASLASIPKPARSPTICCRGRLISGEYSSITIHRR